jgi:soluble lytic murein transglycosylase-like protein
MQLSAWFVPRAAALLTVTALAAAGLAAAPAMAQSGSEQPAQPSFSEQEIVAFATASLEVEDIAQEYGAQISEDTTAEQQQRLRAEASEEMRAAVRDEGLTVDRYNRIHEAAQMDQALAEDIAQQRSRMN